MVKERDHPLWQHNYARSDSGSSLTSLSMMYTYFSDSDDQGGQVDELAMQVNEVPLVGNNAEDPPTYEELYPLQFPLEGGEANAEL